MDLCVIGWSWSNSGCLCPNLPPPKQHPHKTCHRPSSVCRIRPSPQPVTAQAASLAFSLCPNLPPPKQYPGHNRRAAVQHTAGPHPLPACLACLRKARPCALARWPPWPPPPPPWPADRSPQCVQIRQPLSRSRISGLGLTTFERMLGDSLFAAPIPAYVRAARSERDVRCGSGGADARCALAQLIRAGGPCGLGGGPPGPKCRPEAGGEA